MKKQLWVLCKNKHEENELLGILKDYQVDIKCETNKFNFPIVVDTITKSATRCTSVSCCGAYVSSENKMLTLEELKKQYEE